MLACFSTMRVLASGDEWKDPKSGWVTGSASPDPDTETNFSLESFRSGESTARLSCRCLAQVTAIRQEPPAVTPSGAGM